jgi:prepilin-type processing-associated H-X9-DG protein
MFGDVGFTLYNHTLSPNAHTCTNGTAFQQGAWSAGSNHPGGVQVLFVDGHIQFVRDGVREGVWRALGSRHGGEVISSDEF